MKVMGKKLGGEHTRQCLIPLVFFGADYSARGRTLTVAQIRRYGWRQDFQLEKIRETLKGLDVPNVGETYYWGEPRSRESSDPDEVRRFWQMAKRRAGLFRWIPFVKLVGVMNSLSHDNVGRDSDIDFFVIARRGRLWTVRALTLWWLRVLRWRAGKDKYMKVSPDLFLSEEGMDLSQRDIPQDFLLAYWVCDFIPLYRSDFFRKFWQANAWLKEYLPVAYRSPQSRPAMELRGGPTMLIRLGEKILSGRLGDRLEARLRQKQLDIIDRNVRKIGQNPLVLANDHIVKIHFSDDKRHHLNAVVEEFLAEDF